MCREILRASPEDKNNSIVHMLRQELIELKWHPGQNQQAHHGATKIISFSPHIFIHLFIQEVVFFFVLLTCVK